MRSTIGVFLLALFWVVGAGTPAGAQRRAPSAAPRIDVEDYRLEVELQPESHEFTAVATVTFKTLEETDVVAFDISENLSVRRILDPQGIEIEFGQDETGPGILSIHFSRSLPAGASTTIKVEYTGGFDRDRFSRLYSRDESAAYVGSEGTYLLYQAKWFPLNRFLVDRASATVEVTVPLGLTAIGPGKQLPVVTKGISETFGWQSEQPVLPNSIVAGRYLVKRVEADGFTIDCFVRDDHLEAVQKHADAVAAILAFYQKTFGPAASGQMFRIVEVDDRLALQPGFLGSIFLTHRELAQDKPSVRQLARKVAAQWWTESAGIRSTSDLWLADGMAYFSAALYMENSLGADALKDEINKLAVLGLKYESKGAISEGVGLGFRSEPYESVVAGKGAWVLLMLRQLVTPAKFGGVLRKYLEESRVAGGSTDELRKLSEAAYGKELNWFFTQWVDTTGIPNLQVDYMIFKTRDGFRVTGTLKQDRDLFRMPLEVEVRTSSGNDRKTFDVNGKSTPFEIDTQTMPQQVVLDPDSKMLRDSRELQIAVQLSLGDDLKDRGQYVEAIRAYEAALRLNSRKSLAHFRLAEVFWEQFNLQSAANSFRDSLNGDKDPPWIEVWAYIYLGKIYDILNQRQRAMAEYNKALNTKDDTNGAQAEAKKWLGIPYVRERTVMDPESKKPESK